MVIDAIRDTKKLYKIINNITGTKEDNTMPQGDSDMEIAQGFAEYFVEKIDKIRGKFECVPLYSSPVENITRLRKFAPLTETETRRLVSSLQNKSCDIDLVPAKVFQLLQVKLIPIYMRIINLTLGQGEFAQDWKNSSVKPLLKKTGLDLLGKKYRPVSNLMYISKMVEKAALNQFNAHSDNHVLLPHFQSAYREGYSTQTALLKLVSDALWSIENKQILVVAIMDLSTTFDTVDMTSYSVFFISPLISVTQPYPGMRPTIDHVP